MREIVVVGCGLAGYHAAHRIEKKLAGRRRVRLTVVNSRAYFVFTPLLAAVACGELEPANITVPVDELFDPDTRVVVDEVESIELDDRRLVGRRHTVPFDYLVVATGRRRSPGAFAGAERLRGPDTLADATAIREQLDGLAPTTTPPRFAVIGGTARGAQWAGYLAATPDATATSAPIGARVMLYERSGRLLPNHPPEFAEWIHTRLAELGVEIRCADTVVNTDGDRVESDTGARSVEMAFHCAGRTAASAVEASALPVDDTGRIQITPRLEVEGRPGVFAVGDAAATFGGTLRHADPQIARQQGLQAADNLVAAMSGRAQKPFEYRDRGQFIALGPGCTLLEMKGIRLEGTPAWLAYRLYYTALMPRPLAKARLLSDWIGRRLVDSNNGGESGRLPDGD